MSVESSSVFMPRSASRSAVAEAVVVLPTPPLPVNRTMRIAPHRLDALLQFAQRWSITTRSALRLSWPSIGMIRSTLSQYVTCVPVAVRSQGVPPVLRAHHLALGQRPVDLLVAAPGVGEFVVVAHRPGDEA